MSLQRAAHDYVKQRTPYRCSSKHAARNGRSGCARSNARWNSKMVYPRAKYGIEYMQPVQSHMDCCGYGYRSK
eukprot:4291453-Pleurochrysis_carterae.AAC.2